MSTIYLETSTLVAWMFGEPRAAEAQSAIDAATTVVTSDLTHLETARVLLRGERDGQLTEGQAQRLRGQLRRIGEGWVRIALFDDVLERAARPFPVEPVRTLDALHLATALELTKAYPDLRVLSFDERILANAGALGIV